MINLSKISAITVLYNPDLNHDALIEQVSLLGRCGIRHFLIDNGSENTKDLTAFVSRAKLDTLCYIPLCRNFGVGKAVNIGIDMCLSVGDPEWILTLDQDDCFHDDSMSNLLSEFAKIEHKELVGLIGFNHTVLHFNRTRIVNRLDYPVETDMLITSGMLINVKVALQLRYDEGMFIDFLDEDYCIRAGLMGYKIVILSKARIYHHGGKRLIKGNTTYFFQDPERLFYQGRNSTILLLKYRKPKALISTCVFLLMNFHSGHSRLRSILKVLDGIIQGLRSYSGSKP